MDLETLRDQLCEIQDCMCMDPDRATNLISNLIYDIDDELLLSLDDCPPEEIIDLRQEPQMENCKLDLTKFSRELCNLSCYTISNGVIPSVVETIIPTMKYTPSTVYLMVLTILLDMNVEFCYNEVDLSTVNYSMFTERLAKLLLCALGVDETAIAENIYNRDEQLDLYEFLKGDIIDAAQVSLKSSK